jgi:hypothetical protein
MPYRNLIHRASTAIAQATGGMPTCTRRGLAAVAVCRKRGQLLLQLGGMALRTLGPLPTENDSFEFVAAFGA